MTDSFVLGLIQGVAEWLPVSSEGLIVLARLHLLGKGAGLGHSIEQALFLHFGTFLAALIYFRGDVWALLRPLVHGRMPRATGDRKLLGFLVVTTLISGVLGYGLLRAIEGFEHQLQPTGRGVTIAVGVLLLVTAALQLFVPGRGLRGAVDLGLRDGVLLGLSQAAAVLPGLSRSGLTVAALLLLRFREEESLRLSFLMSLPLVLAGNLVLNYDQFLVSLPSLVGLLTSCVFGLLTIDLLLRLARRIQFGYFVLAFAVLTLLAAGLSTVLPPSGSTPVEPASVPHRDAGRFLRDVPTHNTLNRVRSAGAFVGWFRNSSRRHDRDLS